MPCTWFRIITMEHKWKLLDCTKGRADNTCSLTWTSILLLSRILPGYRSREFMSTWHVIDKTKERSCSLIITILLMSKPGYRQRHFCRGLTYYTCMTKWDIEFRRWSTFTFLFYSLCYVFASLD